MLIKYTGKYVKIYFIIKITYSFEGACCLKVSGIKLVPHSYVLIC